MIILRRAPIGLLVTALAAGCGGDAPTEPPDPTETETETETEPTEVPFEGFFQSKSGTTALAADGSWVASTNRDSASITFFLFSEPGALGSASTFTLSLGGESSEVSSIVRGHDDSYLLATLQYDQRVCRVHIVDGVPGVPTCAGTGSEPTSVVTNATGSRVFVANLVDGSISTYDRSLQPLGDLDFSDDNGETGVNPFAMLYLKKEGADGNLYVTDFFAERVPGAQEGSDTGRQGVVYKLAGDAVDADGATKIVLPPLEETGFRIPNDVGACAEDPDAAGCANDTSGAFPNQLSSLFYDQERLFVTSTCASPRGDLRFNMNLHSCVHVIDTTTDQEIPALRLNIQERIKQQQDGADKLFCTVPTDMACVDDTPFCYVTCGSSDLVMRLDYGEFTSAASVEAGLPDVKNLPTGKFPTGISILDDLKLALVNNENSYDVTTLDLNAQTPVSDTPSASLPDPDSVEGRLLQGKDFFFTGRGRWSDARWSSCVGCHPRGLTDNVTWHFPTGPRQTVSMDGSFSKENVAPDGFGNTHGFAQIVDALEASREFPQRIFNWTSVRDEVSDFELNTRGVSGGLGAIVDADDVPIDLAGGNEDQDHLVDGGIGNNANNLGSTTQLIDALDTNRDWDEITEWVKTIRSPRAKTNVAGNVANGRTLFNDSFNCDSCHGGGSWTSSIRYYTPTLATEEPGSAVSDDLRQILMSEVVEGKNLLLVGKTPVFDEQSTCTTDADCLDVFDSCDPDVGQCVSPLLGNEFFASLGRPITQHACVLRDVDTFESPTFAQGALELRKNMVTVAQGDAGFNVPSVLNLQLGAPYLHNGRFESLSALLLDTDDTAHVAAGSAVVDDISAADARDLVAYLLSIDGSTVPRVFQAADVICDPQ
ncbi:MAG: hypothetical protein KTR31_27780 [Myxococcales bacterium]|nr:hypothetical protein [Myxococcales bacterium]